MEPKKIGGGMPLRAVIAIDSFKGSLSSVEAGEAAADGIRAVYENTETLVSPLADGGEGTVSAIVSATGGEMCRVTVTGPLGTPVLAEYGYIKARETAVLEMSAAAGITLLSPEKRNPLYTTTYGVGEMILDAIKKGCRRFLVGIGGSATNDGGVGMLSALGFSFLDKDGREIPRGAIGLASLAKIETKNAHPALSECEFRIASDVENRLCGEKGCSAVFGPQKGATPEMVRDMDTWLSNYAVLTAKATGRDMKETAGAGAAGGIGFAFLSYLNSRLQSGIDLVIAETALEEKIRDADVVVTGEGRLDSQSVMGKAPVGVARLAKKYGKPVIAFAGCVTEDARLCNAHGIDAFFPILRGVVTLDEAMDKENAARNLKATAEQAFRLFRCATEEK